MSVGGVLELQRQAGNEAVSRLLVQRQLDWTRGKLDQPGLGAIGGSSEPYRNLLAALDRYAATSGHDPDNLVVVPVLRDVIRWADRQLDEHPEEARNTAVAHVQSDAQNEVGRVMVVEVERAHHEYQSTPLTFASSEAVLIAANTYLREFGADDAPHVLQIRDAVQDDRARSNLTLNTGYTEEHNLSAVATYHSKPRAAVPAEINCALCTAAAVITNVTGHVVTTGAIVRRLYPPPLNLPAGPQQALNSQQLDYSRVYQHPEIFNQLGRTLQGGMADVSRTVRVNIAAADGIKQTVERYGVQSKGGERRTLPFTDARREMLSSRYDGCVFAVLVESAGHWNFARRTDHGLLFVDYQSDSEDMWGPDAGDTPRMGVKVEDLGAGHNMSFMAFSA